MKQEFLKTEKFLFGFLLFTLIWLPLPLGSNRPWAWALMQMSVFTIGGLLVIINGNTLKRVAHRYKTFVFLWACFLVWQLVNIIPLPIAIVEWLRPQRLALVSDANLIKQQTALPLSFDIGQSHIIFMKSLAYCFLFFITLSLVNTSKRLKYLLISISGAGIFQAIYGALEILMGFEQSIVFRVPVEHIATGSFIYKNHFANFLLLCLSVSIGYLIANLHIGSGVSKREKLRRIIQFWLSNKVLFRIGIIIMVIALVMSRSRMGNSAFFISMTVTASLGLLYFKPRQKSYITLFVSMLIIDILIVSSLFGLKQVQQRLEETSLNHESRDEVIVDALPLLKEYGIAGSGGGTFYTIYPQVQRGSIQHFYDHAHNEYLQFALEFGLIGSLSILLIVIFSFRRSLSAMRHRRHPLARGTAFACVMACIGMALHSSVDFPLQAPANAAYFVVILALGSISRTIKIAR